MTRNARQIQDADAKPFLKWAGGKKKLLGEILSRLPKQIRTYYEPFIGGGAVFFALANERRFEKAVIADRNSTLIEAYRNVRDEVDYLIEVLGEHANYGTDQDYFYEMRAIDASMLSPVD